MEKRQQHQTKFNAFSGNQNESKYYGVDHCKGACVSECECVCVCVSVCVSKWESMSACKIYRFSDKKVRRRIVAIHNRIRIKERKNERKRKIGKHN